MSIEANQQRALLDLMKQTDYPIVQENGQRKFGPPPDHVGQPPSKGSEIFIGKIPRDCFEDELVPLFGNIGKIYELRLMMDFSGLNRGYAFLSYCNPDHAKVAVHKLNNYMIRPCKALGVVRSTDNCRLFIGKIPKDKSREEIIDEMSEVTEGVRDAIVHYNCKDDTKTNRGYAFVEYENHRAAAMARRKLLPGKLPIFGSCDFQVDWADPENELDEELMSKITVLYVRNLSQEVDEYQLCDLFSFNGMLQVQRIKKINNFAFVHYNSHQDAEWALNQTKDDPNFGQNYAALGTSIESTWAKPKDQQSKSRRNRVHVFNQATDFISHSPQRPARVAMHGNPYMNSNMYMNHHHGTGDHFSLQSPIPLPRLNQRNYVAQSPRMMWGGGMLSPRMPHAFNHHSQSMHNPSYSTLWSPNAFSSH